MLAFFSLTLLAPLATALHLVVRGTRELQPFVRRGSGALENGDIAYRTNITLGGRTFDVTVDTGSSDLWVATSVPLSNSIDSGRITSISYAVGGVAGRIKTNQLKDFLGFSVEEQAYIEVFPDPANSLTIEGTGTIGLGPSVGSNIYGELAGSIASVPVIDSIFLQNPSTPNFATYLLGRENDPTGPVNGNITISTILPGYEKVIEQPKVPAVSAKRGDFSHWALLIDAIRAPNGENIDLRPTVPSEDIDKLKVDPDGKLIAAVDTGFTYSQMPSYIIDALYKNVIGAQQVYYGATQLWVFPCVAELDITITIGGKEYPIHSLDASVQVNFKGDICRGAFREMSPSLHIKPVELILGMNFLRNVYMLINHGDFVAGNDANREDPYIQLLSTTTDPHLTHQEFVTVRVGGTQGGGVQGGGAQGGGVQGAAALGDGKSTTQSTKPLVLSWIVIVGIILGVVLILSVLFICYRWRKKSHRGTARGFPFNIPFVGKSRGKYAQVEKDDEVEYLRRTY
ncbi:aspartic peptidase domain-containing protein [Flagelloscypha sp. PMI_526]|nr:aspartic peptidase domain-containing protein [Flagelloscypha sp. PMI_526]